MRKVEFFNHDPGKHGWLHKNGLQIGEKVLVDGRVYRFGLEREGRDGVLTPVDGPLASGQHTKFGGKR